MQQAEKIHQEQTAQSVQTRVPFNLLESILQRSALPEGVAQKSTGRKWNASLMVAAGGID